MTTQKALFVKQSIAIQAPAAKVWQVLTKRELTRQWVREFFGGQDAELVSDWKLGGAVEWKLLADHKTYVEGNVIALEPHKLLRYTVFDVRSERPPVDEADGITFNLVEQGGQTALAVMQGNFGKMDDGVAVWENVLPKIKTVAENSQTD